MTPPAPAARSSLALRCVPLFEGLDAARLDGIAQQCQWQQLPARRRLFSRAAAGGDVYFVLSGRVRVTTYSANGRQVTFRDCGPGEPIGLLAALDGGARSADVVTLESTLVASLPPGDFRALMAAEPGVARRVVEGLCTLVRELSERVIDLSTLGVQNRLHAELLRLARAAGGADAGGRARIEPAPAHAELASRISTNREQVTRELGALTRQGLLAKDGRAFVVTDLARLERMVAEVRGG
ncbi:Crp/Fnr family transcriptional regulator [Paracidovorax konjaci]|uniref:cAMP-binding domain of CRP or a regulatory subunit of cAMP-dependent protein kinases n=1 Tax=Paracidovorax konjaci TaxID=32040 RepID=A0A1I1W4G3_9BURK|nr:Crp/Fnr family transcriptional regulator [Paracidovorax konjaci]SFD89909.1 cAMP-binding domain of CRP or a regulatory subunit of cAMP-dependent protein kinases [Paracidovorax konjaci]